MEHLLDIIDPLLLHWEESESVEALFESFEGIIDESRINQVKLISLHLEIELVLNLSKSQSCSFIQIYLIQVDPDLRFFYFSEHFLQAFETLFVVECFSDVTIIGSADFVDQLTPLPFNHLLHDVKVCVKLLQEQVPLAAEYFFKACKVGHSCLNLLGLLHDAVLQLVLLRFSLGQHLVQSFDIVAFVFIYDGSSTLGLLSAFFLRWAAGRDLVIVLIYFDLHRLIAIRTDRLFVLEAIEAEGFIMLLAYEPLNFD